MLKHKAELDLLFRALSDGTRRAMVDRLAQGEAAVGELAAPFDMSLSAVHQHLTVLRDAGLVTSTKKGRVRICRLEPGTLDTLGDWVAERKRMWGHRLDRLDQYLKEGGNHGHDPNGT